MLYRVFAVFVFVYVYGYSQDGFRIEYYEAFEIVVTPFAEIPCFFANLDEKHSGGKFIETKWNPKKTEFTIKTNQGEWATFSKKDRYWKYVNRVDGVIIETVEECTWVGNRLAQNIFREIERFSVITISVGENNKIKVKSETGDFEKIEDFDLPKGIKFKLIQHGRAMLIWDEKGYLLKVGDFLVYDEDKYLVIYPRVRQTEDGKYLFSWKYRIGGLFEDTEIQPLLNEIMTTIFSRECRDSGKNRYEEIEIKSNTGLSTIFLNIKKKTSRLGRSWENQGLIYEGHDFIVNNDRGNNWRVFINEKATPIFYTVEKKE